MYKKTKMKTTGKYIIMSIVALLMFFPIFWIFINSLKTLVGVSSYPPAFLLKKPQWSNYLTVLQTSNVLDYFRNTVILIFGNTLGTLISSSIVAYPLARMDFKGKGAVFSMIIATMMVPTVTTIIPQFILFRSFGWLDSFLPMIVPAFFAQPYNVFLFRQFFKTIPKSIDESATMDGLNSWQIFTKMIVPLSKGTFITVGVLSAIFWWNELFTPLIYINSESLKPLTLGALNAFKLDGGQNVTAWNLQMAFAMLMAIPPMLLYMFASKYLVGGNATSGDKEG